MAEGSTAAVVSVELLAFRQCAAHPVCTVEHSGAARCAGSRSNVITRRRDTPVTVSGVDENKTITCTDATVNISGIRNTVNITGHCVKVSVSGINNVVTVDIADTIGASGFDNRVTFHSGSPDVDNSDGSTRVEQG